MSIYTLKNKYWTLRGFTLVEMLVVLGLFSFIMTLATSVLYSTQAINVKLQETQSVLDNVNVSLETMVRDIRYGSNFHCMDTLPDMTTDVTYLARRNCNYQNEGEGHGGKVLFLKPIDAVDKDDRIVYFATTTATGMIIQKNEYYFNKPPESFQITADDVKIKALYFYVVGASSTVPEKDGFGDDIVGSEDYVQPLITITASGETIPVKEDSTSTPFVIQTSVSSRVLDN